MNQPIYFPTGETVREHAAEGRHYLMISEKNGNRMWVFGDDPDVLLQAAITLEHTNIIIMHVVKLLS